MLVDRRDALAIVIKIQVLKVFTRKNMWAKMVKQCVLQMEASFET
jgi:hypothetical protein